MKLSICWMCWLPFGINRLWKKLRLPLWPFKSWMTKLLRPIKRKKKKMKKKRPKTVRAPKKRINADCKEKWNKDYNVSTNDLEPRKLLFYLERKRGQGRREQGWRGKGWGGWGEEVVPIDHARRRSCGLEEVQVGINRFDLWPIVREICQWPEIRY